MPAAFGLLGLAGAGVARAATVWLMPYFIVLSILFLGRAFYLIYFQKQGRLWARRFVWFTTAAVFVLWMTKYS